MSCLGNWMALAHLEAQYEGGAGVVERQREETVPDRGMDFRWAATVVTQTPKGFKQGSVIREALGRRMKRGGQGWRWQVLPEGGRASTSSEGS